MQKGYLIHVLNRNGQFQGIEGVLGKRGDPDGMEDYYHIPILEWNAVERMDLMMQKKRSAHSEFRQNLYYSK